MSYAPSYLYPLQPGCFRRTLPFLDQVLIIYLFSKNYLKSRRLPGICSFLLTFLMSSPRTEIMGRMHFDHDTPFLPCTIEQKFPQSLQKHPSQVSIASHQRGTLREEFLRLHIFLSIIYMQLIFQEEFRDYSICYIKK